MEEKKKNTLISVIIPVYNSEKFLDECLTSIINQSYENLEIILIDDSSNDNSLDICKKFQLNDKRIIIETIKHSGPSAVRNYGLSKANGDLISFIDSDDIINSNMLKYLEDALSSTNSDIASCKLTSDFCLFTKKEDQIISKCCMNNIDSVSYMVKSSDYLSSPCNKLYKKELFSKIRYPENRYFEDIATTYKLMVNSKRCVFIDAYLYFYRENPEGICSSFWKLDTKNKIIDNLWSLSELSSCTELSNIKHLNYFRLNYRIAELKKLIRDSKIEDKNRILDYLNSQEEIFFNLNNLGFVNYLKCLIYFRIPFAQKALKKLWDIIH